jgi:multidrug efflux system membrane fusion protein
MKSSTIKMALSNYSIRTMACLMALFILFLSACSKEEEQAPPNKVVRPVKMMTVTSYQEAAKRSFPGKVRASKRVDLAFQVNGPLIELPVEEGQRVKEGDLLARIDPRDFEVNLRNAEGRLENAKASLKAMQQARPEDIRRLTAAVNKAEAALKLGKAEYDRIMRIKAADPGAVSQGMVDRALEKKERAEAELRNAQEELRIGKVGARAEDVAAKRAEIKSLAADVDAAKLQLSYTYLRAPYSGVISKRYVDNFQEIRAKDPIVSLDDISHVEILVDVPEAIIAKVRGAGKVNAVAEFSSAPGNQYPLTLKEYSTRADPKTQTYRVVLQMPQPADLNVLPGMTVNVISTSSPGEGGSGQIVIPADAVFADEAGTPHVWVVDKKTMKVQRRKVTTGNLRGTESIQVTDGLQAGETIAVAGVNQLREGMEVRPLDK